MFKYTTGFYQKQVDGSARSAALVVPVVLDLAPGIESVVDVGCGLGTFLEAFSSEGVSVIQGIDGDYVDREMLRIPDQQFMTKDLSKPLRLDRRFDLAVSLEVAEHLPNERGPSFVRDLTSLSDLILFSAGIPGQGGTHHVNEQWQDYWAAQFLSLGYHPIDAVRERIWGVDDIEAWYRQNTILYANDAALQKYPKLRGKGVTSLCALRVVHPAIWTALPGPGKLWRTIIETISSQVSKRARRMVRSA